MNIYHQDSAIDSPPSSVSSRRNSLSIVDGFRDLVRKKRSKVRRPAVYRGLAPSYLMLRVRLGRLPSLSKSIKLVRVCDARGCIVHVPPSTFSSILHSSTCFSRGSKRTESIRVVVIVTFASISTATARRTHPSVPASSRIDGSACPRRLSDQPFVSCPLFLQLFHSYSCTV